MENLTMQLNANQTVFMVFFAIFWGTIANVQPRWKAFQFPLMFKLGLRLNVCCRVVLAILLLNIFPILYFGYILYFTSLPERCPDGSDTTLIFVIKILIQGVLPALGIFGIYRLWLAIIELKPDLFYKSNSDDIPVEYRHVEPTYRLDYTAGRRDSLPVVDLGRDTGKGNLVAALIYLVMGLISPWLL